MERKKIVIIEDSNFIVSVYRSKLQGEGYDVHVGADGETGLALIGKVKPDMVVLDLGLPKMSGYEVLTHLRGHQEFAALPVLVLSGAYSGAAVDAAWQAGATAVMCKAGSTPNKVVETIRATMAA